MSWLGAFIGITGDVGKVGVCFQQESQWPELTIEEHVRLFARIRGITGQQLTRYGDVI